MKVKELEAVHEEAREIAQRVWGATRWLLLAASIGAWSLFWGVLLLIGYAAGVPGLVEAGTGVLVGTGAAVAVASASRRHRLKRAARVSVLARCRLEGVRLGREMQAIVEAFDVSEQRVRELLLDAEVAAQAAEIREVLDTARTRVFQLAGEDARALLELRRVRRAAGVRSAEALVADAERRLSQARAEADRVALGVRQLSEQLGEARRLLMGAGAESHSTAQLAQAVESLEGLVAAYREIEATTGTKDRDR